MICEEKPLEIEDKTNNTLVNNAPFTFLYRENNRKRFFLH